MSADAASEDRYRFGFSLFSDNREVTVLEQKLELHHSMTDQTSLLLRYNVDAVSSASISCSVCHKERQSWLRNEVTLGGDQKFRDTTLGLAYYNSREKDYSSDALTLSASQNLLQENTTLSFRYTRSWDRGKPHGWKNLQNEVTKREEDDDEVEVFNDFIFSPGEVPPEDVPETDVNTLFVGWTQVLTSRTVAQLSYELTDVEGYQSNPYHIIPINGTDHFERHPDSRRRNALSARLKQALSFSTTLGADYRFYSDDWGVRSNTVNVELFRYLMSKDLLLRARYRYYTQSAADFYEPRYDTLESFITNDDRLQPFHTQIFGVMMSFNLKRLTELSILDRFSIDLEYERYLGNPSSIGMTASGRRIRGSAPDLRSNIFRFGIGPSF